MATPQIGRLIAGTLPEDFCHQTWQRTYETMFRLAGVYALSNASASQYYNFGYFSGTSPDPELRDYPWLRTDVNGNFDKIYTWSTAYGLWVSPHAMQASGKLMLPFYGLEAEVDELDLTAAPSSTISAITGPFWSIISGMTDKFIGGATDDADVNTDGGNTDSEVTLTTDNLPRHRHEFGMEDASSPTVNEGTSDKDDQGAAGMLAGDGSNYYSSANVPDPDEIALTRYYGKTTPDAVDVTNAHKKVYFIQRTARIYYTVA